MTLAPGTASATERRLDAAADVRIAAIPEQLPAAAWDVDQIPASWLPVLAWALSVDLWDPNWAEIDRREAIRNAVDQHREKGTPAGVRRVLDAIGAVYDYEEPAPFLCTITIRNSHSLRLPAISSLTDEINRVKRASVVVTLLSEAGVQADVPIAAGAGVAAVRWLPLEIDEG